MEFTGDFSSEQILALHKALRTSEDFRDEQYDDFTSENTLGRTERHTLTSKNFFQNYSDPNFRRLDDFCKYISSIHYEDVEALKQLFRMMEADLFFELAIHKNRKMFELFVYMRGVDEPEQLEFPYNSSLDDFLNQYITRQINIGVSLEELLTLVGDFTDFQK